MTDVIGTAEIDERPHRRAPRVPRFVLWSAAAIVLAGAIVVPFERGRLADSSARWLQEQWTLRSEYDDARVAVIETVNNRAGVLDEAIVDQSASIADHEEAVALTSLARRLSGRHMWSADVSRARDAALAAVRLEVRVLLRDATGPTPTAGYLFAPEVDKLVSAATRLISAMARERHVGKPPVTQVRLAPAQVALDRLAHRTDVETGLALVLAGEAMPRVLDLDTGALTQIRRIPRSGIGVWSGRLLVLTLRRVALVDAHDRTIATLDARYPELISTGGNRLWVHGRRGVRRFDRQGQADTSWVPLPAGHVAVAATDDAVVLVDVTARGPQLAEMWNPMTGARRQLPTSCSGTWAAAGHTVVMLPCPGDHAITRIDARTGAVRRLRLPGPATDTAVETLNPLSPGGDELAVAVRDHGPRFELIDLRNGRVRRSPFDVSLPPVSWSPDGRWLLFANSVTFGGARRPQAALWRLRDGVRTSLRLSSDAQLVDGADLLALIEE